MKNITEKALFIIKQTNDGNDLDHSHLKLVEMAVNDRLSEEGISTFNSLYEDIKNNKYELPWLHGVQHITCDQQGYIYYKGHEVEHYDYPYEKENKEHLLELAERCKHVESLGATPTCNLVIWRWDWLKDLKADLEWNELLLEGFNAYESDSELLLMFGDKCALFDGNDYQVFESLESFLFHKSAEYRSDEIDYHKLKSCGFGIAQMGQKKDLGGCYASGEGVIAKLKSFNVHSTLLEDL